MGNSDLGFLSTLRSIGIELSRVIEAMATFEDYIAFTAATEDGSDFGLRVSDFVG